MAMMLAVQQMHRLRYKQVAFLGDSELLIRSLQQLAMSGGEKEAIINEANSITKDIIVMAHVNDFTSHYALKEFCSLADNLAKKPGLIIKHT